MALPVERLNASLEGEFHFRGKRVSAPFALPGDLVQFQMGRHGFRIRHIERAAAYPPELPLAKAFCTVYERCGGCRGQHLQYEFQLQLKTGPIREQLRQAYGIEVEVRPAPALQGLRGRMDFVVDGALVGQRAPGEFETLVDIDRCPIQNEAANQALQIFRQSLARFPEAGFQRATQSGSVKYCTLRAGALSGCMILTVVEGQEGSQHYGALLAELQARLAEGGAEADYPWSLVETAVEIQNEMSATPGGRAIFGEAGYRERMGGREFFVPYDGFFQPSPRAFEVALQEMFSCLDQALAERAQQGKAAACALYDLYCGAGILSALCLERATAAFSRVFGYEFSASAVALASANMPDQTLPFSFKAMNLDQAPRELLSAAQGIAIIDPPRAGISKALRRALLDARGLSHIIYVSCNPKTQLQDFAELKESYQLLRAQIIDCYPHTPHLEQVALLRRRDHAGI